MPALPPIDLRIPADSRILEARQGVPAAADLAAYTDANVPSANSLVARQSSNNGILPIPTLYTGIDSGPAPGTVVGIVLGSVVGFVLLLWLLWVLSNGSAGNNVIRTTGDAEEEVVAVRRRSRSPRRARSHRTEMTSRTSPRRDRERVYRSERIVRDFPERSPVREQRDVSRVRSTMIVEERIPERRVDGDDVVEVIEEHSDLNPPRRNRRRSSAGYNRSVVVEDTHESGGGYRPIDPHRYAGGEFKQHRVR